MPRDARAVHARFDKRIEERLDAPARGIEGSKKRLERGAIERQIGRFLGRNSRAAGGFTISINKNEETPSGPELRWSRRPERDDWARL